jgi:lipoyl(octanoyl) transferase
VISVLQLGILDYATALRLQQSLVSLRKEGRISDVLLLLEHTPVITLGRNAKAPNVLASADELADKGVEVFDCDRGGDVTFHGPGQLVGYPIFDLRGFTSAGGARKTMSAVEYVRSLEEVLIRTCADFGIATERIPSLTGVWTSQVRPGTAAPGHAGGTRSRLSAEREPAKIAAIGVHLSRGVTSHGFALNVNVDLDYFNLIIPCGLTSKPVTSMSQELSKPIPLAEVIQSAARNFGMVFHRGVHWLESLDELSPTVGVPLKPPAELRRIRKEEDTFWA